MKRAGLLHGALDRAFDPIARTIVVGMVVRVLVQGLLFILVARGLGVDGYGLFISAVAIVAPFTSFAGLGAAAILMRETSRSGAAFPLEFGRGILVIAGSALPLAAFATLAGKWIAAEIPAAIISCVAVGDLMCAPLVDLV
ncbi:MAG TPA: hypothetical protein VFA81_04755, partial [Burkholderiales bacterium]|nr:hypothetical protein [Burkholderiales bacterium]